MNIVFNAIKIQAIDSGSFMYGNAVDIIDFSDKSDFIISDNLAYIGVRLTLTNKTYGQRGKYAVAHKFTAEILDNTTGSVVASERFTLAMSPWQEYDDARIDIPFTNKDIDPSHDYTVRVVQTVRGRDPRVLVEKSLRFFPADSDVAGPIKVTSGYVLADGVRHRHICSETAIDTRTEISFEFENVNLPPDRLPEVALTVHKTDGIPASGYVRCEAVPGTSRYRAVLPVCFYRGCVGPAHAQIRVFGRPVSGFVFHTDAPRDIAGEFSGTELTVISDFNPDDHPYADA